MTIVRKLNLKFNLVSKHIILIKIHHMKLKVCTLVEQTIQHIEVKHARHAVISKRGSLHTKRHKLYQAEMGGC